MKTKTNMTEEQKAQAAKPVEAYGVKGVQSKPWRKTFKNDAALEAWLDKNDAECHGTRDVEQ